jgi:hypothetical protein
LYSTLFVLGGSLLFFWFLESAFSSALKWTSENTKKKHYIIYIIYITNIQLRMKLCQDIFRNHFKTSHAILKIKSCI